MAESETKPDDGMNWIGKLLAVLLTAAIVCVVFWHSFPFGGDGAAPEGNPNYDRSGDIEEMAGDMYRVYAGQAFVLINGKPAADFAYRLRMMGLVDDDTRNLIRTDLSLTLDPNASKYAGVSDEQMEKIKAIDFPRMVVSDQDDQRFRELWHAWEDADAAHKKAAQDAVLNQLREMSQKAVDPTRHALKTAGEDLKNTLSLQQLAKLALYQETYGSPNGFGGGFWGRRPTSRGR